MIWPTVKKYGKYVLLALLGVGAVVGYFALQSWRKKQTSDDAGVTEGTETLIKVIGGIKDNYREANDVATLEVAAARSDEKATKEKLKQVKKIKSKVDRRKHLADMMGET